MQYLIDFIMRNLLQLWPITRIYEWEGAIMVRRGIIHRPLTPGLHWRWWLIEEKRTYPSTEVVLSLPTGAVTTADGKSIAIDGNVGYCVVDVLKCYRYVWNLDSSIKALAAGLICSELATKDWSALQGDSRKSIEASLIDALNAKVDEWGVKIKRVHLVACVQARQLRHFIDGSLTR